MICPACSAELTEQSISTVKIDICLAGCGGIWFDRAELEHLDEEHEPFPEFGSPNPGNDHRNPSPRTCPRCENNAMAVQHYDQDSPVEIDCCWQCGGIWLDRGELERIRMGAGDRESAGNAMMSERIDLGSLAQRYPEAARRPLAGETVKEHPEFLFGRVKTWIQRSRVR